MVNYKLDAISRMKLQGQIILENLINFKQEFPVLLNGRRYQKMLKPVFVHMLSKGLVKIQEGYYVPTDKGREALVKYLEKYHEFINFYDVFSGVNLDAEEPSEDIFAYNRYWDFDEDHEFEAYANQEKFQDIRVQVLEYKKIHPVEYVFMAFVSEGKLNLESDDWEFQMMSTDMFDEILDICNSRDGIDIDEVEDVMPMVIELGVNVMRDKKIEEDKIEEEVEEGEEYIVEDSNNGEYIYETVSTVNYGIDYVVEPVYELDYYDEYYDPIYISPYMRYYDDSYYW